jgi:hypothetical protein
MAFAAERHQVRFVKPALGGVSQLDYVVDVGGQPHQVVRQTVDTERMFPKVPQPELLPFIVVAALVGGTAAKAG